MTNYIDTSILSISSKNINNCIDVIKVLQKSEISYSVVDNNSVVKDKNNNFIIEHGCNITLTKVNISDIKEKVCTIKRII